MGQATEKSVRSRIQELYAQKETTKWWEWIKRERIESDISYWQTQLAINGFDQEKRNDT